MAIFRGDGGAGDATDDITINQVTTLTQEAANSATAAAASASAASTSASNAASSASAASTSATNAATSATSAASSATAAASSASAAATSATAADASAVSAAAEATFAETAQAAAEAAQAAAETAETNAASSASSASTSASTASTQATNASNSATAAATSEANAATSETNAAASASAAATSETNAATSETNAAASEAAAATSETNAAASETAAASSASSAASSASSASSSASSASTSATNAATSESNAATSETNAAASESAAATSETNAAASASAAATSATNAATSATNAANSATSAASSATAAAASAASAASSDFANFQSSGTANGVAYLNGSKVLTTGSALTFDGTNVGIGTGSPTEKLTVNGGLVVSGDASATSGSGVILSYDTTNLIGNVYSLTPGVAWRDLAIRANSTVFFGAGSEKMRLASTGLGIGTSSPGTKLDVITAGSGVTAIGRFGNTGDNRGVWIGTDSTGNAHIKTYRPSDGDTSGYQLGFGGSTSPSMTLDASGRLLVGGTVSGSDSYATINDGLCILNKSSNTSSLYFGVYGTPTDSYSYIRADARSSGYLAFSTNNTERARIDSSGNLLINTTSGSYKLTLNGQPGANGYTAWTNYSDARLKENVTDFVDAPILDKVCSLRPVTFNYNEASGYDEETRSRRISGFIAQELQQVFPEMVGEFVKDEETYLDTNLSNLTLYLLQAIKELKSEVDALKAK